MAFIVTALTTLDVNLLPNTGGFEIVEGEKIVVTGKIRCGDAGSTLTKYEELDEHEGTTPITLLKDDFYKDLRLRGYDYENEFRGVISATSDGD